MLFASALSFAPSAGALPVPRLNASEIEALRDGIRIVRVPPPAIERGAPRFAYGTATAQQGGELERLAASQADAVDAAAAQAAEAPKDQSHIERCYRDALRGLAKGYRKALADAVKYGTTPQWPDFDADFDGLISGCLSEQLQGAPPGLVDELSSYLSAEAGRYTRQALQTNSAAETLALWLNGTADELADLEVPADEPISSEPPSDASTPDQDDEASSVPTGAIAGIVVGLGAIAAAVMYSRRRQP